MTDLIQNAAAKTNTKVATKSPAQRMQEVLTMQGTQNLLKEVLLNNKEAFVASLIDLYGSDSVLQQCDPGAVLKEALKAVALNLPIAKSLGLAYIIPYRDKNGVQHPQFQPGYRAFIQLAERTRLISKMNNGRVYEGELRVLDKLTGDIDLKGERISDKVIGYFAYFETVYGFGKGSYWSVEKMTEHAKTYSKSYKAGSSIWRDNFHEMAEKTVLKDLLSKWAPLSIDSAGEQLRKAIDYDNEDIIFPDADPETGEITPADGTVA